MTGKLNSLFFVLSMFFSNALFSQNEIVNTNTLHPKTIQFAEEVYQDLTEYQTAEHLETYSKFISQVAVEELGPSASNFETLQNVGIRNKYNPNLTYDEVGFDVANFNPLKYNFDFYSTVVQKYRIGATNYVVSITPSSNH